MVSMVTLKKPITKRMSSAELKERQGSQLRKLADDARKSDQAFVEAVRKLYSQNGDNEPAWSLRQIAAYADLSHTTIKNICDGNDKSGGRWK